MNLLWITIGGALGTFCRYGIAEYFISFLGPGPWGIMLVNIIGSFIIGFVSTFVGPVGFTFTPIMRQFLMIGLCGGFTTFSSFSLQTLNLIEKGDIILAASNILGSVTLCLLSVWLGVRLGMLIK